VRGAGKPGGKHGGTRKRKEVLKSQNERREKLSVSGTTGGVEEVKEALFFCPKGRKRLHTTKTASANDRRDTGKKNHSF